MVDKDGNPIKKKVGVVKKGMKKGKVSQQNHQVTMGSGEIITQYFTKCGHMYDMFKL